jgi:hypothetical protein
MIVVVSMFFPEIWGLAWHLAHGSSAELGGVKFKVPILYHADISSYSSTTTLVMMSTKGRIRSRLKGPSATVMGFASQGKGVIPENFLETMDKAWAHQGYRQTAEKLVTLAEREGKCHEYNAPPLHSEKISLAVSNIEIACLFGDEFVATFMGAPNTINDFYEVIRTAQNSQRRN